MIPQEHLWSQNHWLLVELTWSSNEKKMLPSNWICASNFLNQAWHALCCIIRIKKLETKSSFRRSKFLTFESLHLISYPNYFYFLHDLLLLHCSCIVLCVCRISDFSPKKCSSIIFHRFHGLWSRHEIYFYIERLTYYYILVHSSLLHITHKASYFINMDTHQIHYLLYSLESYETILKKLYNLSLLSHAHTYTSLFMKAFGRCTFHNTNEYMWVHKRGNNFEFCHTTHTYATQIVTRSYVYVCKTSRK